MGGHFVSHKKNHISLPQNILKCFRGRGSVPDPTEEPQRALQTSLLDLVATSWRTGEAKIRKKKSKEKGRLKRGRERELPKKGSVCSVECGCPHASLAGYVPRSTNHNRGHKNLHAQTY